MVRPVLGPVPGSDAAIRTGAFGFLRPGGDVQRVQVGVPVTGCPGVGRGGSGDDAVMMPCWASITGVLVIPTVPIVSRQILVRRQGPGRFELALPHRLRVRPVVVERRRRTTLLVEVATETKLRRARSGWARSLHVEDLRVHIALVTSRSYGFPESAAADDARTENRVSPSVPCPSG